MSASARFSVAAVFLACTVPVVAGCGGTVIDASKIEAELEQSVKHAGANVKSVACPSGVDVKAGATFECTVNLANGKQETATLRIVNSEADVEVTNLKAAK